MLVGCYLVVWCEFGLLSFGLCMNVIELRVSVICARNAGVEFLRLGVLRVCVLFAGGLVFVPLDLCCAGLLII